METNNSEHIGKWTGILPCLQVYSQLKSNLPDVACVTDGGADAGLDIVIIAVVFVLFLTPNQICIWIVISLFFHQIKGEWGQLPKKEICHNVVGMNTQVSATFGVEVCAVLPNKVL